MIPNKCCSHSKNKGAYYLSFRILGTRKGMGVLDFFPSLSMYLMRYLGA